MAKISDRLLRAMIRPATGYDLIRDDDLIGFGVRHTATGCTAFVFSYVVEGRERRTTIGRYPTWSVAAAREEARRLRRIVDSGVDPLAAKEAARAELTLAELWCRYKVEVLPRKAEATQRNERAMWDRHVLPLLGGQRLSRVTPDAVERLHFELSVRTPVLANRCLASIRAVFNKAMGWRLLGLNPASTASKNPEHNRERFLSRDELARLVHALDGRADTPSTLAIRFLLQTGARRGEVLGATWDQFDLVAGVWVKPSSHTKQRRVHRVPLSALAVETLLRAKALSTVTHVFPGRSGAALVELKKMFASVLRDAGITDFRVHDLRHSFASFLVADGTSLPVIGRLLGHTQVATTSRYAHLEDDQLRSATNSIWRANKSEWADHRNAREQLTSWKPRGSSSSRTR